MQADSTAAAPTNAFQRLLLRVHDGHAESISLARGLLEELGDTEEARVLRLALGDPEPVAPTNAEGREAEAVIAALPQGRGLAERLSCAQWLRVRAAREDEPTRTLIATLAQDMLGAGPLESADDLTAALLARLRADGRGLDAEAVMAALVGDHSATLSRAVFLLCSALRTLEHPDAAAIVVMSLSGIPPYAAAGLPTLASDDLPWLLWEVLDGLSVTDLARLERAAVVPQPDDPEPTAPTNGTHK